MAIALKWMVYFILSILGLIVTVTVGGFILAALGIAAVAVIGIIVIAFFAFCIKEWWES